MASLTITQGNVRATATTWAWPLGVRWGTSVVTERLSLRRRWWCPWSSPQPTWVEIGVTSINIIASYEFARPPGSRSVFTRNQTFNGTSRATEFFNSTRPNWIIAHTSRVTITPGPMGSGEAPFTLVMNSV